MLRDDDAYDVQDEYEYSYDHPMPGRSEMFFRIDCILEYFAKIICGYLELYQGQLIVFDIDQCNC